DSPLRALRGGPSHPRRAGGDGGVRRHDGGGAGERRPRHAPARAMSVPRLVLASASPRRLDILRQLGLEPEVRAADVDESLLPGEGPGAHVERLARAKAARVAAASPARESELVLAGDTVVVLEGAVLGKPRDPVHAEEMLLALAGREHEVWSGLAVAGPDGSVSGAARA